MIFGAFRHSRRCLKLSTTKIGMKKSPPPQKKKKMTKCELEKNDLNPNLLQGQTFSDYALRLVGRWPNSARRQAGSGRISVGSIEVFLVVVVSMVVVVVVSMVVVVVAVVVLMVVVVGEEICFALTRDKLLGSNRWIVELTLK